MKQEDNYAYFRLSPEARLLMTLSALPIVDGVFIVFLATGLWQDLWSAAAFGATAFSGAGCIVAAIRLTGTWRDRLRQVVQVYILVTLGATIVTFARPLFVGLLPTELGLYSGVFLLWLGARISGIPLLQGIAGRLPCEGLVIGMMIAAVVRGITVGIVWGVETNPRLVLPLTIAISTGFGLSLAGAILGLLVTQESVRGPLDLGGGISLMLMGCKVLGFGITSVWLIAPLVVGGVITALLLVGRNPGPPSGNAPT